MASLDRSELHRIEVVDDATAEVMRGMTGAEKLCLAWDLFDSARRMLTTSLRTRHPEWDTARVQVEVMRRMSHDAK